MNHAEAVKMVRGKRNAERRKVGNKTIIAININEKGKHTFKGESGEDLEIYLGDQSLLIELLI